MRVIDSHTAGEPTRVVIEGGPDLRGLDSAAVRDWLQLEGDRWRRAIVCEPRGNDVMVGAWLLPATRTDCIAGAVFFNNVGCLGMCGHGAIGVVETLRHLGRLQVGEFGLETPVGVVRARLNEDGRVAITNVPSYRHAANVELEVEDHGVVHGDIAWGGNWFFLVDDHGLEINAANLALLTDSAVRIRRALESAGLRGRDGAVIDHIELVTKSPTPGVDARNFVLCPGLAWDRSPCGTGTSAKLACLAADGTLQEGAPWRQESVIGSEFGASYRHSADGTVVVEITGRAHIVADSTLHFDAHDAFAWGIP
ncbi:MAG: proline racemase family protein [Tahibacter sp.]